LSLDCVVYKRRNAARGYHSDASKRIASKPIASTAPAAAPATIAARAADRTGRRCAELAEQPHCAAIRGEQHAREALAGQTAACGEHRYRLTDVTAKPFNHCFDTFHTLPSLIKRDVTQACRMTLRLGICLRLCIFTPPCFGKLCTGVFRHWRNAAAGCSLQKSKGTAEAGRKYQSQTRAGALCQTPQDTGRNRYSDCCPALSYAYSDGYVPRPHDT